MIYRTAPSTWKDLQDKVAEILNESGIYAESPKVMDSVRNQYEIDVYAEEVIDTRKNITLIECKNWSKNIPQTIVHAFRTTMQDIGANIGYIISKKGFQVGAKKAAENTNVKLVTWLEFQTLFEKKWRQHYLTAYIEKNWGWLMTRAEFAPSTSWDYIYGWMLLGLMSFSIKSLSLPLNQYAEYSDLPKDLINETGFKEIIPLFHKYCDILK